MNPLVVQGAAQLLLGKYKSNSGMLMKNVLTMGATGLIIFAGLGWYLDWYKVNRTTGPDGKQHITIDVNTVRIGSDLQKGKDQVTGYLQNGKPGGVPALTPPMPYPQQPFPNQPQYPQQGGYYPPQQPALPQTGFQPAPTNWAPAAPTSRPTGGGFFTGSQPQPQPVPQQQQYIPGRPF